MEDLKQILSDPRITARRSGEPDPEGRAVVYWMQRAQRAIDNPALEVAIKAANILRRPLTVFFGLHPYYPNANLRHYVFLLQGLRETIEGIERRGAAFVLRVYPRHEIVRFCKEVRPSLVIGDENPLREPESWRETAASDLRVPFWTVDADVVVPSRFFEKEEYSARTIRPKINRLIDVFLHPHGKRKLRYQWHLADKPSSVSLEPESLLKRLPIDRSTPPVNRFKGGTHEAKLRLKRFINERLARYDKNRNLPNIEGTSELSPYLHFGQVSPVSIALAVRDSEAPQAAKEAFLEELIVRRELAINYVKRNPNYDRLEGCHAWARRTLAEHSADPRPYIYSEAKLESARTHDALWNAAQQEMVKTGRMHGYVRMYWAKKILEWSRDPAAAFEIAIRLNDRYELDGRDPNGYAGVAWAIGGKHDRPWAPRRPIFGMIRYMSSLGMARKFDVQAYVDRINAI